jgi:hypothetical protein
MCLEDKYMIYVSVDILKLYVKLSLVVASQEQTVVVAPNAQALGGIPFAFKHPNIFSYYTGIPLKISEFIAVICLGAPRVVIAQRSECGTIEGSFLTFSVGCFMWAPFSVCMRL